MREEFVELIELSRIATECDPWVRQTGMSGYCRELRGEIDEVLNAIRLGDIDNLKEELGDLFLDLARLCALAEEMGHFDIGDILSAGVEKVKRRQPFLRDRRRVTMDEALEYWNSAKSAEKKGTAGSPPAAQ